MDGRGVVVGVRESAGEVSRPFPRDLMLTVRLHIDLLRVCTASSPRH